MEVTNMYEIYNILQNDTLDSIAKKFSTTIDDLLEINGFSNEYQIVPGNNIIVPTNKNNPYKYYSVKKGDNIYQIANNNNIDSSILLAINGLDKEDYIYPNQTLLIPKNNYRFYLTKNKDTIKEILEQLNIDINTLIKENPSLFLATDQIIFFKEK